jgi:hypothetical protein
MFLEQRYSLHTCFDAVDDDRVFRIEHSGSRRLTPITDVDTQRSWCSSKKCREIGETLYQYRNKYLKNEPSFFVKELTIFWNVPVTNLQVPAEVLLHHGRPYPHRETG